MQAEARLVFLSERFFRHCCHRKARRRYPFLKIITIHSHMILLAKSTLAFLFGRDCGIFVRRGGRVLLRDGQDRDAARFQDTPDFLKSPTIIGYMLQHIAADHDVEFRVFHGRHRANIEAPVGVTPVVIRRYVARRRCFDTLAKLPLGREVQDVPAFQQRSLCQIGMRGETVQRRGQQTMAHLAATFRTDRGLVPQIVGKFSATPSTHIALHRIAPQRPFEQLLPSRAIPRRPGASKRASDR